MGMVTPTTSTAKIKLAEPEFFDGSHQQFRDWLRQILVFVQGCKVTDDEDKIFTTLSYMKGGAATVWAQKFVDDHLTAPTLGTWADFVDGLKATFEDKTATWKA
jgi:hypothetical protein